MPYKITEDCVQCGACFYECIFGAIYESETQYIINQEKCTECGICAALYCPAGALISNE